MQREVLTIEINSGCI